MSVSKKIIEATVTNPPHYRQGDIECIEAIKYVNIAVKIK